MEPSRKLGSMADTPWLMRSVVATAKTASTSITGRTAGTAPTTGRVTGAGVAWSLGSSADGKRLRKKVSGKTRTEVRDKLKALHSELDAGVRTAHGYTVEKAVADWLAEGLPGRAVKTVAANRDALRPLLAVIGKIELKDLTVSDVRMALSKMAGTHATRTIQKAHNCLTRTVRHAEGQDLVRRNVSALVTDTPRGQEGRPSQSLTLEQASALLDAAEKSRLHAFTVGTPYESHNLRRDFRRVTAAAGLGPRWVPKEMRTSFVSMMSYSGVPVEEIARLAGHASSRTTEVIYRRELRPVITTGAEVMDQIFRLRLAQETATGTAG
jgi:integrase